MLVRRAGELVRRNAVILAVNCRWRWNHSSNVTVLLVFSQQVRSVFRADHYLPERQHLPIFITARVST